MMTGELTVTFAQGWHDNLVTTEWSNSSEGSTTPAGDVGVLSRVSKPTDKEKLGQLETDLKSKRFAKLSAIVVASKRVTSGPLKVLHGYPVLEPGEACVRKGECLFECELEHEGAKTKVYFYATKDWQLKQSTTKWTYQDYSEFFEALSSLNSAVIYYLTEDYGIADFPEKKTDDSKTISPGSISWTSKLTFLERWLDALKLERLLSGLCELSGDPAEPELLNGDRIRGCDLTVESAYELKTRLFSFSKKMELPAVINVSEHAATPAC